MLESLLINGNKFQPSIDFNLEKKELNISGKILVENNKDFFQPLHTWIESYCDIIKQKTTLIIDLIYYNTSAFKELLSLMHSVSKNNNFNIVWKYDGDDDIALEDAEELQNILGKECFTYKKKD